jgi:hypothetical protein
MAEAIGELGKLLDRVEPLVTTLDASRLALNATGTELTKQVTAYETHMAVITENAKLLAVRHIARRTDEMTRGTVDTQIRAMEEAARTAFRNEVGPALQRVTLPLQDVAALAGRGARPWEWWLTHAATAVVSSAISLGLAAWLWHR